MMQLKRSCLLTIAAISLLPATLAADTPAAIQWVVTSAKATGRNGELFVTSLRIVNPNAIPVSADLYFLPQSALDGSNSALGDNSGATKVTVAVPANQTLALDDILFSTFHATGAGGIRIQSFVGGGAFNPPPAGVWVLSQTLVTNALSSTQVPGTYGFAIPSQNQDQLAAVGETAYVPYISASPSSTSGYRTNLFLLSGNGTDNTTVTVTLRKSDGSAAGTGPKSITLGRSSQTQFNVADFFGYVPAASETNLTALVTVTSGGPVATGASIIDNAIGSISYAPPVKVPVANNGAYGLILDDVDPTTGLVFGFSGRAEIVGSTFNYLSAGIVIPSCAGQDTLFFIQGFGTDPANTTFTKNADGSTSFSGTMKDSSNATSATFVGTIQTKFDGTVFGNITYQRGAAPAGNPCPAASVTYPFAGAKGQAF